MAGRKAWMRATGARKFACSLVENSTSGVSRIQAFV